MVDAVAATLATAMAGDQELANAERAGHFREAVAALSGLFLKAPADVGVAFRDLHEDALAAESSNWIRRFEQGTFRPEFHGTAQKDTLAAGAFLRALDRELHDARPHLGAVSDPGAAYRTPSGTAYVVPRAIPRSATRRPQPFQKRGLLFNRVLPAEIAGLPVRLTEQRVARTPDQPPLFGAALFKDYELKIASTGAGFLLTGIDCPDQLDAIRRQIDTALDAGCTVVTWPELMIPAEARDHIAETLSGFALERAGGKVPALVVAGTWHERQEGGFWQNVGHVFNGSGVPILTFTKVNKFYLKTGQGETPEDIAPGQEIQVLLTDLGAVSFCICKDFCDTTFSAFKELDVELFIVPSLGNMATMDGHQNSAKSMNHGFGTTVFVVQQHIGDPLPDGTTPLGWVLARSNLGKPLEDLVQNALWGTYQ